MSVMVAAKMLLGKKLPELDRQQDIARVLERVLLSLSPGTCELADGNQVP